MGNAINKRRFCTASKQAMFHGAMPEDARLWRPVRRFSATQGTAQALYQRHFSATLR